MGKKSKDLTQEEWLEQALVSESEWPYRVPENWVWVRLGAVVSVSKDKKDQFDEEGLKYVGLEHIESDCGLVGFSAASSIRSLKNVFRRGDILYGKLRPYLNKHDIAPFDGVCSTDILVLKPTNSTNNKYVNYLLGTSELLGFAVNNSKGINLPRVSENELLSFPAPLPPLEEQQRIVDRIESLFEKLDKAKGLIQEALDSFENRRVAILHKAFSGELTKKWRKENGVDSPDDIVESIVTQRKNLMNISKDVLLYADFTSFSELVDDNGWIRLKTILFCDNITCGGTPTGNITDTGEIPFLKVYNIVKNRIDFESKPQFIDNKTHNSKMRSSTLKPDDVVMNIVGPPLRKIAIIPDSYSEWNMNQAIVRFRTVDYVEPKYLYYALLNSSTLDSIIQETKGVVGQANISITQSRNLTIPIAPNQEQREIIKILDDMLNKENEAEYLMNQIEKIEATKKSILSKAFRGELGTNDSTDENALALMHEIVS